MLVGLLKEYILADDMQIAGVAKGAFPAPRGFLKKNREGISRAAISDHLRPRLSGQARRRSKAHRVWSGQMLFGEDFGASQSRKNQSVVSESVVRDASFFGRTS